jgi:hypothetical protein
MFELAGALIIGVLTLLVIKFLLARGIVLGSRRKEPERAKRRPVQQRWTHTEQPSQRQRPPETGARGRDMAPSATRVCRETIQATRRERVVEGS